jgi:hypothetical protein
MLGAVLLTTVACARRSSDDVRPASGVDSIVLQRTACYGNCPTYRVRITGTGAVSFTPERDTRRTKPAERTVAADSVAALVEEARRVGFFELPDTLQSSERYCAAMATDNPTAILAFYVRGARKEVVDYHGCGNVPADVRRLEDAVDSVAGTGRWIGESR